MAEDRLSTASGATSGLLGVSPGTLAELCRTHHIRKLSLFGSALRGELRPDSDLDLLVEFEPERVPGFFRLAATERELSELFGRKVDLRTEGDLSRHFRDEIVRQSRLIYAAE